MAEEESQEAGGPGSGGEENDNLPLGKTMSNKDFLRLLFFNVACIM